MDAIGGTQAEEDESNPVVTTIKASPPWLISCLVHMVLIIALGLIPFLASQSDELVELVVGNTEDAGEVMDLETMDDEALLNPDDFMQVLPDDLVVEDPMASAEPLEISTDDLFGALDLEAPKMGLMLSGREEGMKKFLLAAYGGSDKTQAAVLYGLNWLAKKQDSDGLWSLTGRFRTDARSKSATYRDGSHDENKCAATALAMLAFQGYGQSHFDGPHEMFRLAVEKGMKGLLRCQAADGSFTKNARVEQPHLTRHHVTYTQAMCAFALSELYAMTKDSSLRVPAQKAIDYLVENQDRLGGWKYQPGTGADLSVTGWVMMALQSARMAELEVPQRTLYAIEGFLDKVARDGGRKYAYDAFRPQWSLAMTAEGLLCRQYLGWSQDDEKMVDGAKLLAANPIEFNTEYQDVYYWYYATQVLHNMEDDNWNRWNAVMKRELPARQVMEGKETGSWDPKGDAWGPHGGRLYVTALSIFMLETYYRHLDRKSVV